ncbi:MAG TPA: D-alanine--D-alanine ligase [Candidatus Paceibacterota bacterium]
MKKLKVAVLMGGPSSEHEVSLHSGEEVLKNLDKNKYNVLPVTIDKRGFWLFTGPKSQPLSEPEGILMLQRNNVDVAFIAMHGEYGEDGTVQYILRAGDIPFTGSHTLQSALAMNKAVSASILKNHGLMTPEFVTVHSTQWHKNPATIVREAVSKIGLPLVVKPSNRGSSVGVNLIRELDNLKFTKVIQAVDHALSFGQEAMIQKYITGRELTCAILEHGGVPQPILPTEIKPAKNDFFDYSSKYAESGAEEITPPELMSKDMIKNIQETALTAHKALGCRGLSRTDMILGHDKNLYVLEVNTLPGLTSTSLLPKAALASGINFPKLLDIIIDSALV